MAAKFVVCLRCDCLKRFSHGIVTKLELMFYKLGGLVARNPWKTIIVCVLVCGLMGLGLIRWNEETGYIENWLPHDSRVHGEYKWITENFPESVRVETLIIEDENVLSPESINAMYDIYETTRSLQTSTGENITRTCRVTGILDLWSYDASIIRDLTEDDIFISVNQEKIISSSFKTEINLEKILGHIQRNNEGKITGAQATTMFWFLEVNSTTKPSVMNWEREFIHLVNNIGHPHLKNIFIYSPRTYDDEALGTVLTDMRLLAFGFCLVFVYLSLSIGKCSFVHHKVLLAFAGLASIGMSIAFTYGFGFLAGIMFGPLHQGTPFLLLGIGVDDIFVIMESLNHLTAEEKELPVDRRIAYTMKHAGVSITVTSVTDIVAFAIGSSTVIPGLSTFCIYAATGIFALYVLQATFFVACLALDERRQERVRNACVICYRHQDTYKPNKHYTFSVQHEFMKKVWAPALTKTPVKIVVILLTVGLTSLNVWSFCHLPQEYDPMMYLPRNSYAKKYVDADREYFPENGAYVELYCGKADYASNIDQLLRLYEEIRRKPTVQATTVDFWLASFQRWLAQPMFSLQSDSVHTILQTRSSKRDLSQKLVDEKVHNISISHTSSLRTSKVPTYDSVGGSSSKEKSGTLHNVETEMLRDGSFSPHASSSTSPSSSLDESQGSYSFLSSFFGSMQFNFSDPLSQTYGFLAPLLQFLLTPEGRVYMRSIKFDNLTAPTDVVGSLLTFRHVKCQTSKCSIAAMDDMRELVDGFKLKGGGTCFVYSNPEYMYNETNKVIKVELYRNLALAAVAVFVVTLLLITNVWTSFLVFICVVCTVIDVAGVMNFWNITIDTAASVLLILCFGLAVDFSAHVGHSFMTKKGSRNERLEKTVVSIGPAVFSGGFSTFLAFVFLCKSASYAFVLFFRIFTLVVVFGIFHGLTFLPVILSVVGPPPYETKISSDSRKYSKQNGHTHDNPLSNGTAEVVHLRDFSIVESESRESIDSMSSVSIGSLLDQCGREGIANLDPEYSGLSDEQLPTESWSETRTLEPH